MRRGSAPSTPNVARHTAAIALACVLTPPLEALANFSWFIGVALAALFCWLAARNTRVTSE
jgi:NCS1 family nucleobase:cation symporter-1